jgi:hypothetical protein
MATSIYDLCFLITTNKDTFGIVGMQTDDTIILADERFLAREEEELKQAKYTTKPKEKLTAVNPLLFNGCVLSLQGDQMTLCQKDQGKKLRLVDSEILDFRQQYIKQRARGAYIASICQPKAVFDLSFAAQHQDPNKQDVIALDKRLK